jgi:hypothetical protein
MSSISQQTSTTNIPREQHVALFQVINKTRMLNGWTTKTAQELDATIRTWGEVMNRHRIPIEHYPELYLRAFDARQESLRKSDHVPSMDATLLVAQWPGLRDELEQRRIAEGRTLPEAAKAACGFCYGTGMRTVQEGGYSVAKKCDHK